MLRFIFLLALCASTVTRTMGSHGDATAPERMTRNGLPGTATHMGKRGELRVAYLGGSITAAEGWRPLTTTFLRELLPDSAITEIAAGVPGTGSDLGVCRLGADVLRHRPDLLFVEFAVNDANTAPADIERTMEGIVRQTWRANPATDICFVYTVSTPGWPDVQAGNYPASVRAMETVAAHYGIPTVQLGFEVARRVADKGMLFKGTAQDGDRAFSVDGVHPTPAGHRVYADVLRRALPEFLKTTASRPPLPPSLRADNWEHAEQRVLSREMFRGEWKAVPLDDENLRGATKALLPPTWRADKAGDAIEFDFTGTHLGLLGIAAPDSGWFTVTVDGNAPVTDTFFDAYVTPTFCRARKWFYPQPLPPGKHRVRVELSDRAVDKAAIKQAAGKTLADPELYAQQRLALSALLLIDTAP
ncbi:GDSL family lipase [Nibricoccus aquaticus]|uniref:GDSL family lipase n=2 Tax=Nibricoccus aquaticus TaxID=2576891 RepID=A0A290QMW3_9BACT|nr:GDSL family lipase [Nibricoccus aquaticus]